MLLFNHSSGSLQHGRHFWKNPGLKSASLGVLPKSITSWLCGLGHLLNLSESQFLYLKKRDNNTYLMANANFNCNNSQPKARHLR